MTTRRELDRLTDPDDYPTESEIGDMARQQAEDREQQRRERAANNVIQVHIDPPKVRVEDVHPCLVGRHRPAWLVTGQVACGVCGARL